MDVDAVVLGTGLTESIAAAALSKAGFKVAHVDANPYYGGNDASLTLDELIEWADARSASSELDAASPYLSAQRARYTSLSRSGSVLPQSRQYSLSLAPAIIPSVGPLIDALIASGVSRYGGFKLLEKVAIYDGPGTVKAVPGGKEDVFKSKELSLLEKRRLMRFLMFAAGEFEGKKELEGKEQAPFVQFLRETFSLDGHSSEAIAYALAFCTSASDPTLPALLRIRQYLRSAGRYGPSPFLVGHYGGLGEIAQGFCRTSAVNGATYILGRRISSLDRVVASSEEVSSSHSGGKYKIELEEVPEQLVCDLIVTSPNYLTPQLAQDAGGTGGERGHPIARFIAIIDRPVCFLSVQQPTEEVAESSLDGDIAQDPVDTPPAEPAATNVVDTALLVFPPSSIPAGSTTVAANVLITGEGSMSAPRDKWVLYVSLPLLEETTQTAEELLRPYLNATLTLASPPPDSPAPVQPLFTLCYIEHPPTPHSPTPHTDNSPTVLVMPPCTSLITEVADSATIHAESAFWKAVQALKASGRRPRRVVDDAEVEEEAEVGDIDALWPPLDAVDEPDEDW